MDVERKLRELQKQNDFLQETVYRLREALTETRMLPREWRLTPSEQNIIGVMVNREVGTYEAFLTALYLAKGRPEASQKILQVFICRLRKKLEPFGIEIHTIWGRGWALSPAARAMLRAEKTRIAA